MKLSQAFLLISIVAAGAVAMAADAHGGGDHGMTDQVKTTLFWQAVNVTVMFAGLIYLLRKPVRDFFSNKKSSFVAAAEKANEIRKQAEQEQSDIRVRLTKLESTADESISRARAEAADMKKQMILEAETMTKKIKEEAEAAARLEIEKAKNKLRNQMIADAIEQAKNNIETKVSSEDHKRLQGDFINNIQAVQQ